MDFCFDNASHEEVGSLSRETTYDVHNWYLQATTRISLVSSEVITRRLDHIYHQTYL